MPSDRPDLVISPRPLNEYARWLVKRIPFVFSRWGDGEWSAVLGRSGANTDKQPYTADLQADLIRVLEDKPSYLLGLQPMAVRLLGADIAAWLRARDFWPAWEDSDVWHKASRSGRIKPIVKALRTRRVLLVGPARLRGLARSVPFAAFVEIPNRAAHARLPEMRANLQAALTDFGPDGVVAVCAGMSANILIHDYCGPKRTTIGPPRTTWIDFGAVWEPYIGHANRTYHAQVLARLAMEGTIR